MDIATIILTLLILEAILFASWWILLKLIQLSTPTDPTRRAPWDTLPWSWPRNK